MVEKISDPAEWITDPVIKDLLAELNPEGYVQICRPLGGSRKNPNINSVYKICYLDSSQRPTNDLIVKVGTMDSLKKEFENYSKYVNRGSLPSEYKVDLFDPISHNDKAILPIDVVNLDNHTVLTEYYKEKPIEVLETLLNKALKPWHENGRPMLDVLEHYIASRLQYHQDNLNEECERLFPDFVNKYQCYVQQLKCSLTNPVYLLKRNKLALKTNDEFWTIKSIVHGDLNFNNIFVEDEKHLKLIDYENTDEDIVFNDLARLECEIKFVSLKNYEYPSFWQGLLEFEELITKQFLITEDDLSESAKEFEELKKAAKCIAIIRKRADEIINQSSRVKKMAYWIELLIRTLKYVSYKSEDGISQLADSQKKYALISSLLLADRCLEGCEKELEQLQPINIFSGPQLKDDPILIKEEKQESEYLSQLRRILLAGNMMLFLGPDAPKATKAPTKSELAEKLYKKYTGNEPKLKKPDLLFSLLFKLQDIQHSLNEDIYTAYKSVELQDFYQFLPRVRFKRIYNQYVDFLIERSYEELEIKKIQNYENRFSPKESRDDEDLDTVIIERPYGSARFYDDKNRSMQLSADSIAKGKGLRDKWYDLIRDIRAPLSVLFYGFDWENLHELYFDIKERINFVDENSYCFWLAEEFPEEDANEASVMGLKIIQYPFEKLLKEIVYLDKEKPKEEVGKGIKISLKDNKSIFLDPQTAENHSKYFEIIHDEIEKTSDLEIGPFFQGEEINWKELAANCDVYRNQIKNSSLEKRIEKEIVSVAANRAILLLGEYAGAGTTTIMKRLGFNITKKQICPVVYLHRIDANTWKILEDFYQYCNKQKFLILMDNVSPISEKFRELYGVLQSRRVHNVILATARKDEWNQVRISYIQSSGADIDERERQKIKLFEWLTQETIGDRLSGEEKYLILRKYKDFGVLTAHATSRFGKGYLDKEIRYSNLLPLCWAATEGKNRKFELVVKEYYDKKLNSSERRIVDIVCAVNLFYSKGITDRILHRIVKVNWDRLKLLLSSDSMRQLIMMIKPDYYDEKLVYRIVPRNYGVSEILLRSQAFDFPQRVLKILTENLSISEGEVVEEDLLYNIVSSKQLHKYLADKSLKNELFEFGYNQSPTDIRILQHWGIMLYEHAREQANFGNLDDPAWEESIDQLNHALKIDPYNSAIYHSLGMANMTRGGLFWDNYRRNHLDTLSYNLADLYHQKALKCFHKSLDLNSHDEYAYNTIARILLKRLSFLKKDEKNIEEFENLMAEVHELLDECGNMVPIDKQVELKATMADWERIRGNSLKAKRQYTEILDENPRNHSVSYLLATLLMEEKTIGSLEEAEEVIVKALAEGTRSKGFYKLRYHIAERLYPFDYPKLETILKGLVGIYPEDPYLIFKYAVICFKNENYNLSDQYFRVSEKLRFGDPVRFELHDYIWKRVDDPDKIEQIWDEKYKFSLLKLFEGNIQTIDDRKGYVIMDKSGERVHFNPQRILGDKSFQEGQRVKFTIAFTYIGPTAIDLDYV